MTSELMAVMEQGTHWLAGRLLAASLQGAVVIGLVWLVSWRFTSMPPSVRALLWWLASLKLMLSLATLPAVSVPVLPAEPQVAVPIETAAVAGRVPVSPIASTTTAEGVFSGWSARSKWIAGSVAIWLLGVGAHTIVLFAGFRRVRRVLACSIPVSGDDAALARRLATQIGLRTVPDVCVSEEIDTPQVVRARRPVVVLPASLPGSMTEEERAMLLCHELVHVRRRDLQLGWVPACAERIFFFHPLARLAAREFVLAREAICDTAVLQVLGVAPLDYGRFLLRLGIRGTHPGLSAAASSRSASSLRRRLDMLHHVPHLRPRRAVWLAAALAICAVPPLQLVARTPGAGNGGSNLAAPSIVDGAPDQVPVTFEGTVELVDASGSISVQGQVTVESPSRPPAATDWPSTVLAAAEARRLAKRAQSQNTGLLVEAMARRLKEAALAAEAQRTKQTPAVQQIVKETTLHSLLQELSARLRELERALRQEQGIDRKQAAEEIQRIEETVLRERLLGLAELSKGLEQIDRSVSLTDQADELRRKQESIMAQMQDLLAQQEVLKEKHQVLTSEAERIRQAIEEAIRERAKSAAPAK